MFFLDHPGKAFQPLLPSSQPLLAEPHQLRQRVLMITWGPPGIQNSLSILKSLLQYIYQLSFCCKNINILMGSGDSHVSVFSAYHICLTSGMKNRRKFRDVRSKYNIHVTELFGMGSLLPLFKTLFASRLRTSTASTCFFQYTLVLHTTSASNGMLQGMPTPSPDISPLCVCIISTGELSQARNPDIWCILCILCTSRCC